MSPQPQEYWERGLAVLDFRDYIALNRTLIRVLGLNSAVLACELVSEARYWMARGQFDDGWFYSTVKNIQEQCGLSKHNQSDAFKDLKERGIVELEYRGLPKRRYIRIDTHKLLDLIDSAPVVHIGATGGSYRGQQWSTSGPLVVHGSDVNKHNKQVDTTYSGEVGYQPSRPSEYDLLVSSGFVPPTLDEVKDFFATNLLDQSDAEDFWLHYQSQNWVRGNGIPIGDWHALAVSWNKRDKVWRSTEKRDTKPDYGYLNDGWEVG